MANVREGGKGPDGGFNISNFKAFRETAGVTHTHSYTVSFGALPSGLSVYGPVFSDLEMMCDSVNFPATALDTYNVQYYGYGNVVKRPTVPDLSPIQCSFLDDSNANVCRMMNAWQRSAVNYSGDSNALGGQGPYEINYLTDYATDLYIRTYNPVGTLVREAVFREAYPIVVPDIQYSWGRLNEVVKVPVVFAYTDWREDLDVNEWSATLPSSTSSGGTF